MRILIVVLREELGVSQLLLYNGSPRAKEDRHVLWELLVRCMITS
jgi:hypothetical protein